MMRDLRTGPGATPYARPRRLSLVGVLTALCSLLTLGLVLGPSPGVALAEGADALRWSVRTEDNDQGAGRPNFSYQLDPGQVVTDGLVVANGGSEELRLRVYGADAHTTASGHLDLAPADEPAVDVGGWIVPTTEEVVIAPAESALVEFEVRVPADAAPGDHPGGLVTSLVQTEQADTVRVERRLGSRVHVRVSGEQRVAMTATDLTLAADVPWQPWRPTTVTVDYTLTNTGNVRTLANSELRLSGPFGLQPTTVAGEPLEITPGDTVRQQQVLPGVWPLGPLTADLTLRPEAVAGTVAPPLQLSAAGTAVSLTALALIALLVLAAVVAGVARGRRTPLVGAGVAPTVPDPVADTGGAPDRADPDRADPDRADLDRADLDRADPDRADPDRAGPPAPDPATTTPGDQP